MKRKYLLCILLLCIVVSGISAEAKEVSTRINSSGKGIVQLVSAEEQPKVVSVILDNSSSMVKGENDYTTRWIEADYTVKALAAMMDAKDLLRLYVMSGYREDDIESNCSESGEFIITEKKEETINKICGYLDEMQFSYLTYFQGVNKAAEEIRENGYLDEGKDCWIVILTDGSFYSPEKMDAEKLTEELKKITTPDIYGKGRIRVAYIPVGEVDECVQIKEDIENGIYVSNIIDETENDQDSLILKKVTDIINRIYGRVRLEEDILKKYLPQDEQGLKFCIDVPLERLIVFMQQSGSKQKFIDFENISDISIENEKMSVNMAAIPVPVQMTLSDDTKFEGRDTLPSSEEKDPSKIDYDPQEAVYKELQGRMLFYKKDSNSQSIFQSEDFVMPFNGGNQPNVEIYYEPAVKVGLEYIQNGEPVEHIEGCLSNMGENGHEELCLREGGLTVRLRLTDDRGNELPNMDSDLLHKDKFSVRLVSEEDGIESQIMLPTENEYEFTGLLEQKDYKIVVTTPWNELETGVIKVQEKRKKLEITLFDADRIWLNESEEGASLIKVQVEEDGVIPPNEIIEQMDVNCPYEDEKYIMERVESSESGVWLFRLVPKDPFDHIAPDNINVHISASRPYQIGGPEIAELDAIILLTSYEEELLVNLKTCESISVWKLLFPAFSEKVLLEYECKDVLDEKQKELVVNEEVLVKPENLETHISLGKDGNVHIKRDLRWFFMDEEEVNITFHSSYILWNTRNTTDCSFTITFKAIPVWQRHLIIGIISFIFFWLVTCICRMGMPSYIKKFDATLVSEKVVDMPLDLKLDRRLHRMLFFYKTVFLYYKNGEILKNPIMPTMRLKIRKNTYGEGYEIVNYGDFTDSKKYSINQRAITKDNRIFDNENLFFVKDKKGIEFRIRID